MSTQVFPALVGLGWNVNRQPIWSNSRKPSVSGKETAISYWSYPQWQWTLSHEFLRVSENELQQLVGFFNARRGGFDSFLYADADDYSITAQLIGTGDGATTAFQLIRSFGGFNEPIYAPNAIDTVTIDGVAVDPGDFTVSAWGSSTPGIITFDTAPPDGDDIEATFTFRFPCRFDDDRLDLSKFMADLYEARSLRFHSLK